MNSTNRIAMNALNLRTPQAPHAAASVFRSGSACRLCSFPLRREDGDDLAAGLCGSCKKSPEASALPDSPLRLVVQGGHPAAATGVTASPFAQLLGGKPPASAAPTGITANRPAAPRQFGDADLALVKKIGAFMPADKLLDILNERLSADLGSGGEPYTMEDLSAALQEAHGGASPAALGRDWPSVRKLLSQARRAGVLDAINEQVINDFAVVFQLNAKQVVELKDIVLGAKED